MKVRCIELRNTLGVPISSSPWLTKGALYDVLSMRIETEIRVTIQVLTDPHHMPGIFDFALFEIIDNALPQNWTVEKEDGIITFSPKSWRVLGFWEKFFDNDDECRKIFADELAQIIAK